MPRLDAQQRPDQSLAAEELMNAQHTQGMQLDGSCLPNPQARPTMLTLATVGTGHEREADQAHKLGCR